MDDKQINAMQAIVKALDGLDEADLRVVLGFVGMRYGPVKVPAAPSFAAAGMIPPVGNGSPVGTETYSTFPDLYHAANPGTEAEKALVAGYWVQVCEQKGQFDSFAANSVLKDMGYPISNITRALDFLMSQEPKYVRVNKKTGTSRQARKTYQLTQSGLKRVGEMLQRAAE